MAYIGFRGLPRLWGTFSGIIGDVKGLGLRDWGLGFRGSENEGCLLEAPFHNDCGISGSISGSLPPILGNYHLLAGLSNGDPKQGLGFGA